MICTSTRLLPYYVLFKYDDRPALVWSSGYSTVIRSPPELHSTTNKRPHKWLGEISSTLAADINTGPHGWTETRGNVDLPPPLVQLGFNAYESTGLSLFQLFATVGKGGKSILKLQNVCLKEMPRRQNSPSSEHILCFPSKSASEVELLSDSKGHWCLCWVLPLLTVIPLA